jgi:hypothetical protein
LKNRIQSQNPGCCRFYGNSTGITLSIRYIKQLSDHYYYYYFKKEEDKIEEHMMPEKKNVHMTRRGEKEEAQAY